MSPPTATTPTPANWSPSTTPSPTLHTPDISHTYGRRGERVRTVDGSETIDYGYKDALQLQTETHARSNGTHVITRTHESNGTGTVAGRLSGVRLQSPGAPAYRLDYGYQLNQYTYTTESGVSNKIHHDPDGNLTNDARFAYEWNGENRLVTATPFAPTNGAKQVRSDYDHQGRHWRKRVYTFTAATWQRHSVGFALA